MELPKAEEKKPRRRVKKARGHGGHHGGAWKVAYADFVTAMMALFLVLWLVSQADTKLKQAIASYFRSPGVFDSMKGGILSQAKKVSKEPTSQTSKDDEQLLFSVAQTLQKQFSTRPEFSRYKDQIKIDVTDEGLRIQLIDKADRVSFGSGSADLTSDAQAILAEIANGICSLPNKINIGGHTDSRVFPSNNGYTNWELSADRANAARRVLETNCVKSDQIHRIVGFADTEPLVPEDLYSPANRRISITVLRTVPVSQPRPGEMNGDDKDSANPKPEPEAKQTPVAAKTPDSAETRLANKRLQTAGSISVGESDPIPDKPKVKP
ncbi:MAG: flagellar motor protein MotB [Acidobacteriota bacterium]